MFRNSSWKRSLTVLFFILLSLGYLLFTEFVLQILQLFTDITTLQKADRNAPSQKRNIPFSKINNHSSLKPLGFKKGSARKCGSLKKKVNI